MHNYIFLILLFAWNLILCTAINEHPYREHQRYRRASNTFGDAESPPLLDLNATVPYIFSARVYPYGQANGDLLASAAIEPYRLENPMHFLGNVFDTIYIHNDGSVGLTPSHSESSPLPSPHPMMAIFWQNTKGARVFYRETDDPTTINLAYNEVNIQYRYGSSFRVKSVVIITWESGTHVDSSNTEGNIFQLALIIGDKQTFAHVIYSRLTSYFNAVAGFSSYNSSYSLPDSGTNDVVLLAEKSDIGIPGEWLFQIDAEQVYLCGAGFKGLECIESCASSQWSNDCSRSCHCDGNDPCDQENGRCPNDKCSPGWHGSPICDKDIDECVVNPDICPVEQPDCLNTPGSFLCLCYEYDEVTKLCKGATLPKASHEQIPVDVMQLSPSMHTSTTTQASIRFPSIARSSRIQAKTCNCDTNAQCIDNKCICKSGWTGDGESCHDIDECRIASTCPQKNTRCVNVPGSYQCNCLHGYIYKNGQCNDINECDHSPCGNDEAMQCVNLQGSYRCQCQDGFLGNSTLGCLDINECEESNACGDHAICSNTKGGYECECEEGYERISETGGCRDIDECAIQPCHSAAQCINMEGTFECQCLEGFIGDGIECHETILYPISNDSIVVPRSPSEAIVSVVLAQPIRMFGRNCKTVFVSSNGLLSFDSPIAGVVNEPYNLGKIVIFPLHTTFNYSSQGLVAYTYVNATDKAASALITRSSLSVINQYGLLNFRTRNLHIFTFDRMLQAESNMVNSFQVVLAESDSSTVLTLIYEKAESATAIIGIATPQAYHPLPTYTIANQSNVGTPGRWMFRVDGPLDVCPTGHVNPPYCNSVCQSGHWGSKCLNVCHCSGGQSCDVVSGICPKGVCATGWKGVHCDEDVNECEELVTCGKNSECVNTAGSYECRCSEGFELGSNNECEAIDYCFLVNKARCHQNAYCESKTRCICHPGYTGNGFTCTPKTTIKLLDFSSQSSPKPVPISTKPSPNAASPIYPFVMNSWITPELPTPVTSKPTAKTTSLPTLPTTNATEEGETESLTMLFLAMPGALCLIWFALVIIVIVMCWRHKRGRSATHNTYDDRVVNVWRQANYKTKMDVTPKYHPPRRNLAIEPKMIAFDY
ncbi:unnamed protein product [Auanema sp. JU1783]|nr:unnamed protein product [Auanema sp. JU1783]